MSWKLLFKYLFLFVCFSECYASLDDSIASRGSTRDFVEAGKYIVPLLFSSLIIQFVVRLVWRQLRVEPLLLLLWGWCVCQIFLYPYEYTTHEFLRLGIGRNSFQMAPLMAILMSVTFIYSLNRQKSDRGCDVEVVGNSYILGLGVAIACAVFEVIYTTSHSFNFTSFLPGFTTTIVAIASIVVSFVYSRSIKYSLMFSPQIFLMLGASGALSSFIVRLSTSTSIFSLPAFHGNCIHFHYSRIMFYGFVLSAIIHILKKRGLIRLKMRV